MRDVLTRLLLTGLGAFVAYNLGIFAGGILWVLAGSPGDEDIGFTLAVAVATLAGIWGGFTGWRIGRRVERDRSSSGADT